MSAAQWPGVEGDEDADAEADGAGVGEDETWVAHDAEDGDVGAHEAGLVHLPASVDEGLVHGDAGARFAGVGVADQHVGGVRHGHVCAGVVGLVELFEFEGEGEGDAAGAIGKDAGPAGELDGDGGLPREDLLGATSGADDERRAAFLGIRGAGEG
jgi:hypothetical protein